MSWTKWIISALVGCLILAGIYHFTGPAVKKPSVETLRIVNAKGVEHSFEVEVARTPAEQELGLMFREQMGADHGMLFEMGQPSVLHFWMKNTLIPLDMLFISSSGVVKKIRENAVPRSLEGISSEVSVSAVLELNGGQAKALGIAVGDKVIHPYFKE